MLKAYPADGTALIGKVTLMDTMEDIVVGAAAAVVVAMAGYMANKRKALAERSRHEYQGIR